MGMYDDVMHQGRSLPEWREALKGAYSLGELYRMASEGCDFSRLVLSDAGVVSEK